MQRQKQYQNQITTECTFKHYSAWLFLRNNAISKIVANIKLFLNVLSDKLSTTDSLSEIGILSAVFNLQHLTENRMEKAKVTCVNIIIYFAC